MGFDLYGEGPFNPPKDDEDIWKDENFEKREQYFAEKRKFERDNPGYYFHANVLWYNIADTVDYVSLSFMHNTTTHRVAWNNEVADNIPTGADFTQQGDIMLQLSKNDTVVVRVQYQDVAPVATEEIIGHGAGTHHYTQFFGYRV